MARVYTKIGDVFFAELTGETKKYFQYIANDRNQLGSDFIRVFSKVYNLKDEPELYQVVKGDVEFYAHCSVNSGVKLGHWKKVGNIYEKGDLNKVLFRSKKDYGIADLNIRGLSHQWEVWNIKDYIIHKMDKLGKEYRGVDIGPIIPPEWIVSRMKTGKYDFVYPAIDE